MSGLLVGKLAFITGAGAGIGRATAQIFAKEGATVIASDLNKQNVDETVKLLGNGNHLSIQLDVSKAESVKNALSTVLEQHKTPPNVIVNCAGITRDNFMLKMSEADFDAVINCNLKGTFLVMQTFVNALVANGATSGSVVNIASIIGKYGNIGQTNYSASKAGVELLTKSAAKEFGKFGIRCNSVLPGFIDTNMTRVVPENLKGMFLKMIPAGRYGKPEEIGEVITFLASDKSSYINGAAIEVTGGF